MDVQLHYIEKGNGEPLILLHGNDENLDYFENQIEYFSKKYRVIAVDTRGHGKSPRGEAPFTLEQFAEDLHDFMNSLSIEKSNILGFSDGGNIALLFALKYPQRVNRLILNGANLFPSGIKKSVQILIGVGYRTASLFAKISPKARQKAEMLRLMVEEPQIDPNSLADFTVRTLVIAGTADVVKDEHTKLIYHSLPNAELAFLPGDHFIANRDPGMFNRAVDRFLIR